MIRSDDSNQAEQWGRAARRGSTTVAACRSDSPACLADGAHAIAQVARLAGRASVSLWSARVS